MGWPVGWREGSGRAGTRLWEEASAMWRRRICPLVLLHWSCLVVVVQALTGLPIKYRPTDRPEGSLGAQGPPSSFAVSFLLFLSGHPHPMPSALFTDQRLSPPHLSL